MNSYLSIRISGTLRERLYAEASNRGLTPSQLTRQLIDANCPRRAQPAGQELVETR